MGRLYGDYACVLVGRSPRVRKNPPISAQPGAQNTFIFLSSKTRNNSCKIMKDFQLILKKLVDLGVSDATLE